MNDTLRSHPGPTVREYRSNLNARGRYASPSLDTATRQWRDEGEPALNRLTGRAAVVARDSARWVRDGGELVRLRASRASDRAVERVREAPVRSILLAAALGAMIFAVARMGSRRPR